MPVMTTSNTMSAAQQARQSARQGDGKYSEMGHLESGDLDLGGLGGDPELAKAISDVRDHLASLEACDTDEDRDALLADSRDWTEKLVDAYPGGGYDGLDDDLEARVDELRYAEAHGGYNPDDPVAVRDHDQRWADLADDMADAAPAAVELSTEQGVRGAVDAFSDEARTAFLEHMDYGEDDWHDANLDDPDLMRDARAMVTQTREEFADETTEATSKTSPADRARFAERDAAEAAEQAVNDEARATLARLWGREPDGLTDAGVWRQLNDRRTHGVDNGREDLESLMERRHAEMLHADEVRERTLGDGYRADEKGSVLGDTSLAGEYGNRRTWDNGDGTFTHAEVTYGVVARASEDTEWEGFEVSSAQDVDWDDHQRMVSARDELQRQSDLAATGAGRDEMQARADAFPALQYAVTSQTEWLKFTDLDDRGGTQVGSEYEYADHTTVAFATVDEAQQDAESRASAENWSMYAPEKAFKE